MQRGMISCLVAVLTCTSVWAAEPRLKASGRPRLTASDRRDRMFPRLVVESGGRRGTCDALTFTHDGKYLLAAGDDRVVRRWQCRNGKVDPRNLDPLRWSVWGPQQGPIYCLAVSHDSEARLLAIGGPGMQSTTAAVIDRVTGEVLSTVYVWDHYDPAEGEIGFKAVRAITFSPDDKAIAFGSEDGSVWLWRPKSKAEIKLRWIGKHPTEEKEKLNRVRLLHFLNDDELLSVAENGGVIRWDLAEFQWDRAGSSAKKQPKELFKDLDRNIRDVILSPDRQWLAAGAMKGAHIYLRSLDGKQIRDIHPHPKKYHLVSGLAFDPSGRWLAAGLRSRVQKTGNYFLWDNDQIALYDLRQNQPVLAKELRHTGAVDVLAFHPDGKHLAVAGGDNHEVTVWDRSGEPKRTDVLRGAGSGLWNVALSADERHLAFQTKRNPKAKDPNRRGDEASWTVFDLLELTWSAPDSFTPRQPTEDHSGGWRVKPKSSFAWCVVSPDQKTEHDLPWDRDRQDLPGCYAFLPHAEGEPVRLAVGHYFGVSIYELSETKAPKRIWWGMGHEGHVTALAVSSKGDWMVSASDDQTIAAWSLSRVRGSGPESRFRTEQEKIFVYTELGARFRIENGRIIVHDVELCSPAWEAGLVVNDEIVQLKVKSQLAFRSPNAAGNKPPVGDSRSFVAALKARKAEQLLTFRVKRGREEVEAFSSVFQRPLWRFFPMRNNEWVLWMWGYHYYDCSTNGDSFIGWQMNNDDLKKTPTFFQADQFRGLFKNSAAIEQLLDRRHEQRNDQDRIRSAIESALAEVGEKDAKAALKPPQFERFDSVRVRIKPSIQEVKDAEDVQVSVEIDPRSPNPDYRPVRAELWINDHRLEVWNNLNGRALQTTYTIKRNKLRQGNNYLTLQCYNNVLGRGEGRLEASERIHCRNKIAQSNLRGFVVGINDYSRSVPIRGTRLKNLHTPIYDMEAIQEAWMNQPNAKRKLYASVDIPLLSERNGRANKQSILGELTRLEKEVSAEDQVFVFLAGHGTVRDPKGEKLFVFCCPDFDLQNRQTFITASELYEHLARIPCRKVLFLDVCHSGEAVEPARDLTPGGQGPIILSACGRSQSSYEPKQQMGKPVTDHSFFVAALLEAFQLADHNNDGDLDVDEIYEYTLKRVPELIRKAKENIVQTPDRFLPKLSERNVLLARSSPVRR